MNGIAVLKSIADNDLETTLWQSKAKSSVVTTRKSVADAPRLLGYHVDVNGQWGKELGRWKLKAIRFGNKVKNA